MNLDILAMQVEGIASRLWHEKRRLMSYVPEYLMLQEINFVTSVEGDLKRIADDAKSLSERLEKLLEDIKAGRREHAL